MQARRVLRLPRSPRKLAEGIRNGQRVAKGFPKDGTWYTHRKDHRNSCQELVKMASDAEPILRTYGTVNLQTLYPRPPQALNPGPWLSHHGLARGPIREEWAHYFKPR